MEVKMKRFALTALALILVFSFVYAEIQQPGPAKKMIDIPQGKARQTTRDVPNYHFTRTPYSLMTNFYDYMIGSYSSLPLRVIPDEFGGGYFMVYHGRREADSQRRVYFAYLDSDGNMVNNDEITNVQNHEGFPTMVLDPVSGKPFYAWHANRDSDSELEVEFVSDAFMTGIPAIWNDIQIIADNPTSLTAPNGIITDDNEFIWPTAVIGPSPVDGKRRIYVSMRNNTTHANGDRPSENPLIAYTDVDEHMVLMGIAPIWNYTSVPTYDLWNIDADFLRRPYSTICADDAGNLYYIGYHVAYDGDDNDLEEEDLHVLKCDNYGEGNWTMYSRYSNLYAWNPPSSPTDDTPYFRDENDQPYGPDALRWSILNSSHVNATQDRLGKIHFPALWGLTTNENTYYPAMQYVKEMVFDPNTNEIEIREVYPQKDPSNNEYEYFHPWDTEEPWGEAEYIESNGEYYLDILSDWPFAHWDKGAHTDAMMFHYNNIKMSKPNEYGMTVMVWQDSERARYFNELNAAEYVDFANTPEIMIAVSGDNGETWSEPINLNNQETPQMQGLKPMYVYPADSVIYTGSSGGYNMGKIGFMFYDDFTWGSNVNSPYYHPNPDGGQTMFMELEIAFPSTDSDDPIAQTPSLNILGANYPNPFNPSTTISYNMPNNGKAKLQVYNLRGQLVRSLVNEHKTGGSHKVVWDGKDDNGNTVPSGLYFYRLDAGKYSQTRKMMLMK